MGVQLMRMALCHLNVLRNASRPASRFQPAILPADVHDLRFDHVLARVNAFAAQAGSGAPRFTLPRCAPTKSKGEYAPMGIHRTRVIGPPNARDPLAPLYRPLHQ